MLNEGGGSVDESDTRDKKCFFKTIIARVTNAEWKLVTSSLGRNYDDVNVWQRVSFIAESERWNIKLATRYRFSSVLFFYSTITKI